MLQSCLVLLSLCLGMLQSCLSLRERGFYRLKIVAKAGDLSLEFLDFSVVLLRALAIYSGGFAK